MVGELTVRAGVIGDDHRTYNAVDHIRSSLTHAGRMIGVTIETRWLPTPSLRHDVERQLLDFDAVWCGPCGPYINGSAALRAIRYAREQRLPFLGTCAGFQHAAIEYARNVLGFADAEHAETNPGAAQPVVAPLPSPLFERTAAVLLAPTSRCAAIYQRTEVAEWYRCHFGLNPTYLPVLHRGGLRVAGIDEEGMAAIFEQPDHPFYVGTLFMPERRSRAEEPHPLVRALVQAAVARKQGGSIN